MHILFIQEGRSALHEAVESGNLEICRGLLKAGASLKLKDEVGLTPLTLAQQLENPEILKILSTVKSEKRKPARQSQKVNAGDEVESSRGRGLPAMTSSPELIAL